MISFETSIRIRRPIEEVFDFVSDPIRFPLWNSAVQVVHGTSGETGERGSIYAMERELPTGRVENVLEVIARKRPTEFGIRTTSGPTPFVYHYRFTSDGADTLVQLDASVELDGVATLLGPLAARAVRRGVDANFTALKHTLEASARRDRPSFDGDADVRDSTAKLRAPTVTRAESDAHRLGGLVEDGIFERRPDPEHAGDILTEPRRGGGKLRDDPVAMALRKPHRLLEPVQT